MSIVCPLPSCYLIIVSVAPPVSSSLPPFVSLFILRGGFCSSLFHFIIKKTHLPEFDSSPSSLQLIPDTGSKDQVFYSNFCSKTCLSKFSTIVAHYDKTVNEKHNHKTKVDPNIEILTLMSFQTKNKVSSGLLHCVFLLITAINYKMIIRSRSLGKMTNLIIIKSNYS